MTRLNFTGRQKILRKDVRAEINTDDGKLVLTSILNLPGAGEYQFPDDARIILEVRDKLTFMRFELGTVESQIGIQREHLFEFDQTAVGALLLDVRVLRSDGCILGSARAIRPKLPDEDTRGRRALLPFHASDTLGQRLWRLDLEDEYPYVEINRGVGDWNAFARQEMFVALVYPELVRAIARWELDQKREPDDDAPWTKFLVDLGHNPANAPDAEDEIRREEWLDDVAHSFAECHELLKKLELDEQEEEEG